jgi:uncharacterized protein (TIGR03435 family)
MRRTANTSTFVFALLATSRLIAQTSPPEKFEVASVKVSPFANVACTPTDRIGCSNFSPWGGAAFTATNVSLSALVTLAYGVSGDQVSGSDKLGTQRYDVSARPEGGGALTYQRSMPMLRELLEERFQLATHREEKDVSGYVLLIAKDGAKLRNSSGTGGQINIYSGGLAGPGMTMDTLAAVLARPLGRPVENQTGITGNYDIQLSYAPEGSADDRTSRPSIFTAMQEQLGLKLESRKVPTEFLVIDRCNPVPTEN